MIISAVLCVESWLLQGQDVASPHMEWDHVQRRGHCHQPGLDLGPGTISSQQSGDQEPPGLWRQVQVSAGGSFLQDWRYQQRLSPQELSVNVPCDLICGKLVPQWSSNCAAICCVIEEQSVEIW